MAILHSFFLLSFFIVAIVSNSNLSKATFQPLGLPFKFPVTVADGFVAHLVFSNLTTPRGITFDENGSVLVVERGLGVTVLSEAQNRSGWERGVLISNPNFTQGIQVEGRRLYVSTAGEVLLYEYDATTKTVQGEPTTIINQIPPDGDLTTHTLQLEKGSAQIDRLLIAVGPFTNIDTTARNPSSGRSQIRRCTLRSSSIAYIPISQSFLDCELLAFGIRNPAGFAFAPKSKFRTLYVVENGASIDNVTGLTAAFVNDNPADELERVQFDKLSRSYGFPDCTTLWNPLADPLGVPQFSNLSRGAQFSFQLETGKDDNWCQNRSNNEPPVFSFQAHSVPLDIKFYEPTSAMSHHYGFPNSFAGDAFISFHGSFNRNPPTGYSVVRLPFSDSGPSATDVQTLIQPMNITACLNPSQCLRPVGLAFDDRGRLFVSSDATGELLFLEAA